MAYTGNDPLKKVYYEKLIEAGFSDEDANLLARLDTTSLSGRVLTPKGMISEEGFSGLMNYLKSKL